MRIYCLSLNHHCTPIEVRERVAFDRDAGQAFLRELCVPDGAEGVLLSTCNRTEVYATLPAGDQSTPYARVFELLAKYRKFEPRSAPPNFWRGEGHPAVTHLFRVAAGLESQVLGESQILGQVKTGLEWADEAGTSGRVMRRLWERAIRVGKRVRSETTIGDGALSHAYAALELGRKVFGGLENNRVLVIGTGEIGTLALENLRGVETAGIAVMNRTRERAEMLAASHNAEIRDFSDLEKALVEADLVFTSTGSTEPIITRKLLKRVRAARGGRRPILLIDLALPRDVEPAGSQVDGVYLKNLDNLAAIVSTNERQRQEEIPRAESIVAAGCSTFFEWLAALAVEPAIRELRGSFEQARQEEMLLARGKLDEDAWAILEETTRRLIGRLLHLPSANLKRDDALRDPEILALVRRLFLEELPHPAAASQEEAPNRSTETE